MKTKLIFLLLLKGMLQAQTLVWTKPMADNNSPHSNYITTDNSGNSFITGWFSGTIDFDPGPATYTLFNPNPSAFVVKKDQQGNFLWASNLEGGSSNGRFNICADNSGNIYVHGFFRGNCDFDPGSGVQTLSTNTAVPSQYFSGYDQFIWKLNSNGNLIWAKHMAINQFVYDMKTDAFGNLYTVGTFDGNCDLDPGAGVSTLTSLGGHDGFLTKFDAAGNVIYAKQIGGINAITSLNSVTIDPLNNICATGIFSGNIDVDPGTGVHNLNAPTQQFFSVRLNVTGAVLSAYNFIAPAGSIIKSDLHDGYGNLYITGTFSGTCDFDPGIATYNLQSAQGIFLVKLDPDGNFLWAKAVDLSIAPANSQPITLRIDNATNIYFSAMYSGTIDVNPGPGTSLLTTSYPAYTFFICALNPNGNFISGANIYYADWTIDLTGDIYTVDLYSINKYSSITTGLDETDTNLSFQLNVYPNPSDGSFSLKTQFLKGKYTLEVSNSLGQKLQEQTIDSEISTVDLTNYQNGVYLLRLSNKGALVGQTRVIKQ